MRWTDRAITRGLISYKPCHNIVETVYHYFPNVGCKKTTTHRQVNIVLGMGCFNECDGACRWTSDKAIARG